MEQQTAAAECSGGLWETSKMPPNTCYHNHISLHWLFSAIYFTCSQLHHYNFITIQSTDLLLIFLKSQWDSIQATRYNFKPSQRGMFDLVCWEIFLDAITYGCFPLLFIRGCSKQRRQMALTMTHKGWDIALCMWYNIYRIYMIYINMGRGRCYGSEWLSGGWA